MAFRAIRSISLSSVIAGDRRERGDPTLRVILSEAKDLVQLRVGRMRSLNKLGMTF
jgi:hypothetical protein